MPWLALLVMAIASIPIARSLQQADEVYGLVICSTGICSALLGFAAAPLIAQIALVLAAVGWLQFQSLRA